MLENGSGRTSDPVRKRASAAGQKQGCRVGAGEGEILGDGGRERSELEV